MKITGLCGRATPVTGTRSAWGSCPGTSLVHREGWPRIIHLDSERCCSCEVTPVFCRNWRQLRRTALGLHSDFQDMSSTDTACENAARCCVDPSSPKEGSIARELQRMEHCGTLVAAHISSRLDDAFGM